MTRSGRRTDWCSLAWLVSRGFANNALSADRTDDALMLRPLNRRKSNQRPNQGISRGIQGHFAVATRWTAPIAFDGVKPQGRGVLMIRARGKRGRHTERRSGSDRELASSDQCVATACAVGARTSGEAPGWSESGQRKAAGYSSTGPAVSG